MSKTLGLIAVWTVLLTGTASAQLRGRVIAGGAEQVDVLVTLETLNGQIIHQAYTSSRGDFRLEGVGLSSANPMYLVVEHEGYKPFRHHIIEQDVRSAPMFLVYLEPEGPETTAADGADGALSVDVRQLQAEIPDEAIREWEDALEESEGGNYERAAESLERAVELAPDYYDAWIDLGGQYDRLGRFEDAEAAFLKASEVNPAGALAPLNLGALHYRRGEGLRAEGDPAGLDSYALAGEWLGKAVDLNPASAEARFYLGATYYRLNLYDLSEQMLRSALTLNENYPDVRLMLINVYARQNQYEAALEQADTFLDNNPDAPQREAIERVRSQLEDALGR